MRKPLLFAVLILPALILTYYGMQLYFLNRKETDQNAKVAQLLQEKYQIWQQKVDSFVLNDASHRISPAEALVLIDLQMTLKTDNLYLSVDSIIVQKKVQQDSLIYIYDYDRIEIKPKKLTAGSRIWDGKYIVNARNEVLGLTHNQTGYLLMIQHAIEALGNFDHPDSIAERRKSRLFSANFSINDAIINQRSSMIGVDSSRKYLIQLSMKMPDAAYLGQSNKIAVSQDFHDLTNSFIHVGWLLILCTLITGWLFWRLYVLSETSKRLLSSLNKTPCAIAICEKNGEMSWVNDTFSLWNKHQPVAGKNIRELIRHPDFNSIHQKSLEQPGVTAHYFAPMGTKTVHSGITYDAENNALILVETDVSQLKNIYDGQLHALKNLIKQVKELEAQIILGHIPLSEEARVLALLQNNNHTLEKALLAYENSKIMLTGGVNYTEFIDYDLDIGLEGILNWFYSLLKPLHIEVELETNGLVIAGTLHSIELVFQNAIFNAIQAIREASGGPHFIQIHAEEVGEYVQVAISDSGLPFPDSLSFEEMVQSTQGYGLRTISEEMERLGGHCSGFIETKGRKALLLRFKKA